MRPRHYTAENAALAGMDVLEEFASMRPRHYTAENQTQIEDNLAALGLQ